MYPFFPIFISVSRKATSPLTTRDQNSRDALYYRALSPGDTI